MSNEQYLHTQKMLMGAAALVADLELAGFRSRIAMATALGPVLDPTMFREAQENIEAFDRIAAAAMPLAEEFRRLRERVAAGQGE